MALGEIIIYVLFIVWLLVVAFICFVIWRFSRHILRHIFQLRRLRKDTEHTREMEMILDEESQKKSARERKEKLEAELKLERARERRWELELERSLRGEKK